MGLPIILFVDDEIGGIDSYYQEFQFEYGNRYEVVFKDDTDSAYEFIKENYKSIKIVILDLMMPIGHKLDEQYRTVDELRCGLFFKKKIREISNSMRFVIFTNFSTDKIFREKIEQEHNCFILEKQNFLPFELSAELSKYL